MAAASESQVVAGDVGPALITGRCRDGRTLVACQLFHIPRTAASDWISAPVLERPNVLNVLSPLRPYSLKPGGGELAS